MTLIDSKGRVFGKISILDVGAALIILMVLFGIFSIPAPQVRSLRWGPFLNQSKWM